MDKIYAYTKKLYSGCIITYVNGSETVLPDNVRQEEFTDANAVKSFAQETGATEIMFGFRGRDIPSRSVPIGNVKKIDKALRRINSYLQQAPA